MQRCLKCIFIKMFVGKMGNKEENVIYFFFTVQFQQDLKNNYMSFFEMIHEDKQQQAW